MLPTITLYKGCIGGQFLPSTQGIIFPIHRGEGQRLDVQQNSFIGMWSMYLCFTISDLACCQDTYDTISWWRRGRYLLLAQEMDPRIQTKEGKGGAVQRNWSMWMCCPLFHRNVVDSTCDHDFANVTRNGCIGGRFLPPTQGIVLPIHRDEGKRYVVQQNLFIGMWSMYLCLTFLELACCQDTYATFTWCSGGWFLPLTQGMDSPVHRIEDWGHAMYVMSIMGVSYMFCYSQSVCPHPLLPRSFTMDVVVVMEDTAGRPPEHHRYTYSWRLWPTYVRKVDYESVLRVFVTHKVSGCLFGHVPSPWLMRLSRRAPAGKPPNHLPYVYDCRLYARNVRKADYWSVLRVLVLTKCLSASSCHVPAHVWHGCCWSCPLKSTAEFLPYIDTSQDSVLGMYVRLNMGVSFVFLVSHCVLLSVFGHVSTPFWCEFYGGILLHGKQIIFTMQTMDDSMPLRIIGSHKASTRPLGHFSYPCFVSMLRSSTVQSPQTHLVYTWKGELVLLALVPVLTPFSKRCKLPHSLSHSMAFTHKAT